MYFSCNVSFSSLPVFLPTILNEMGFSSIHAQGLSAPPYFLAFLVVILSTYIADRTQQRGLVIMFLSVLGAIGYILLVNIKSQTIHPREFKLTCSGYHFRNRTPLHWCFPRRRRNLPRHR